MCTDKFLAHSNRYMPSFLPSFLMFQLNSARLPFHRVGARFAEKVYSFSNALSAELTDRTVTFSRYQLKECRGQLFMDSLVC
jgi:hypothetical protein